MQIADLKQHVGEEVTLTVYLQDVTETANKFNNKWQDLVVSDITGVTTFKLWAEALGMTGGVKHLVGTVVKVTGKVDLFQNRGGMNVASIEPAEEGTYSMADFFSAIKGDELEPLQERLWNLIERVEDVPHRSLLKKIFSSVKKLLASKHGGSEHHQFYGGLLLHLVETAELAVVSAEQYRSVERPYSQPLDLDLVIAGALLHDIGKLTTLTNNPDGKKTTRGLLVDVATESVLYATGYNNKLDKETRVPDLAPLIHCILMAESSKEDARPRTMEALIVRNANMVSIQRDAFSLAFEGKTKKSNGLAYSKTLGAYLLATEKR